MGLFGWLEFREGLPLWWSYKLNHKDKESIEATFEGIAKTRVALLSDWTNEQWDFLGKSATDIARIPQADWDPYLDKRLQKNGYFTELFLLNKDKRVVCSTYAKHRGFTYSGKQQPIYTRAVDQVIHTKSYLLYGPFLDPITWDIGHDLHDSMTKSPSCFYSRFFRKMHYPIY